MPTTVSRWDPFTEINTMRGLMDRLLDGLRASCN